jgi:serine/threonine protein phosphatase PrpC
LTATLEIEIASCSEAGARERNEDHLQHGALPAGWYAVLSDGAGGHDNGALASDLAVRLAAHELVARTQQAPLPREALAEIVLGAHAAISGRQRDLRGAQRMHATLVVLWIDRATQQATWSHVGDSRLYVLRRGRVRQVTRDDSVVQSLVDAGLLAPHQARTHPHRHQITAALGSDEPIEPHLCDAALELSDGDAFLLCSDGWHDELDVADIESSFAMAGSAAEWLVAMRERLRQRQRPDQDNLSAIAVWVGDPAAVTRYDTIRGEPT